tara:strand:- start:284 stop:613 length:330 start_codon:yes stop_codon:yes gene_type:complete
MKDGKINLNNYEYVYYFEDDGILRGVSKSNETASYKKDEVKKAIKENGYHFYTIGDGGPEENMPKSYGYYYSEGSSGKSTMDFEPLDFKTYTDGDAWLFYKENNKWEQL